MASGGEKGISGWARVEWGKPQWRAWLVLACIGAVEATVNATSGIMEAARNGAERPAWATFVWEYSSLLLLLALSPLVFEAIRRLPPRRDNLVRFALVHAALTLPFSIVHVAGMVAIRKAAYALTGRFYDFSHGNLPLEFVYEWRKDVLSYALGAAVFYLFLRNAQKPSDDGRIELRDGATAAYVAPTDILFVEAAGNYVEFHTPTKTHLVRATLASWEARLTARDFVRVHRSRLVNRAHIAQIKPTPSGDVDITLDDGRVVVGSRRYRSALEAAPTA